MKSVRTATTLMLLILISATVAGDELPLPVSEVRRDKPVDFGAEILPLLKRNCLACHHAKEAEGGLNLETHESLTAGGDSGPGVVANDLEASLLMSRATGAEEPLMPPEDNEVGAKPFTPEELGLIQLWIRQGAKAGSTMTEGPIQWKPIPESMRTIYAVDVAPDGQWAVAGRGNRAVVLDLDAKTISARLVDSELAAGDAGEVTDLDLIQSVAFSPDAQRIATGGFRTVKIWKRVYPSLAIQGTPMESAAGRITYSPDRKSVAFVNAIGDIEVRQLDGAGTTQNVSTGVAAVTGLAWGGDRIAHCDQTGKVAVWSVASGSLLTETQHPSPLRDVRITADGNWIAAIDADGNAKLWRIAEGDDGKRRLDALTHDSVAAVTGINALDITSTPKPFVALASGSTVSWVDLADGKVTHTLDHGAEVHAVAVASAGDRIATGGVDGKVRLWTTADGKSTATTEGTPQSRLILARAVGDAARQKKAVGRLSAEVTELEKALTKESESLKKVTEERDKATASVAAEEKKRADAAAKVAATQAIIDKAKADGESAQNAVTANQQVLVAAQQKATQLDAETQAKQQELTAAQSAATEAQKQIDAANAALAKAKADSDRLSQELQAKKQAVAAANGEATKAQSEIDAATKRLADAKAQGESSAKAIEAEKKAVTAAEAAKAKQEAELAKREQAFETATRAHQRASQAIPAQKQLVTAATLRQKLLDQEQARLQRRFSDSRNGVVSLSFSVDGKTIASAHDRGEARIYRCSNGLPLAAFSPDSDRRPSGVVFGEGATLCLYQQSGSPRRWSTESEWELERKIGSVDQSPLSDRVTALDFRPDGLTLAVGSGPPSRAGQVLVFAVENGQLLRDYGDIHSDTVLGVRFSPDGRSLASSAADKTVRLLDLASGKVVRTLEGHTHHVLALDWQDDCQTIASAGADQQVKVWNVATGEQRRTIGGFPKEVTAINFVPGTNQVLTACADGQARLHDTGNGKAVRSFNSGGDFLFAIAVTAEGETLVAAGQSGVVRGWKVGDGKLTHEWK